MTLNPSFAEIIDDLIYISESKILPTTMLAFSPYTKVMFFWIPNKLQHTFNVSLSLPVWNLYKYARQISIEDNIVIIYVFIGQLFMFVYEKRSFKI